MKIVYPDFKNSLINVAASIQKRFGKAVSFPTIKELDEAIKNKKHVIVLLLDGLGINVLKANLSPSSFLRLHLVKEITSVFPSTTASATTAFLQAKLPGKTGWFGWHQYFPSMNANIIMFNNYDYYTGELKNENEKNRFIKYHEFGYDLDCEYETLWPAFKEGGFNNLKSMLEYALKLANSDEETFTYCYWDNPDTLLHCNGVSHKLVKDYLISVDKMLDVINSKKKDDTAFIIIADHGVLDVEAIRLDKYSDVYKYLTKLPSVEGRAQVFYVSDKEGFKLAFNKEFSKYFDLYETDDFIKMGMVGEVKPEFRHFLGDFIAIAKDKYYFTIKDEEPMRAHHAGVTEEEMMIPLIIF